MTPNHRPFVVKPFRRRCARQISAVPEEVRAVTVSRDAYARSTDSPHVPAVLEERIVELQTNLAGVTAQNERLASTLREARD
ncbi:hypothetical protein, partial [Kitasatospora indigofera]|uniref:hypothetical protein n=1 Tax=Kitasatospora indigofera TaxID=67307 RepID=UPI0036B08E4E